MVNRVAHLKAVAVFLLIAIVIIVKVSNPSDGGRVNGHFLERTKFIHPVSMAAGKLRDEYGLAYQMLAREHKGDLLRQISGGKPTRMRQVALSAASGFPRSFIDNKESWPSFLCIPRDPHQFPPALYIFQQTTLLSFLTAAVSLLVLSLFASRWLRIQTPVLCLQAGLSSESICSTCHSPNGAVHMSDMDIQIRVSSLC